MKRLLTIALSLWLFAAHADKPKPEPAPGSLPELMFAPFVVGELREFLLPDAPATIRDGPEDALYVAPTENHLRDIVHFWRKNRSTTRYTSEAWDCDDAAREFLYWARRWGAERGFPGAILVAKAYVRLDGIYELFPSNPWARGYHVLNLVRRADGAWLFFEPQSGVFVPVAGPIYEGSLELMKVQY